MKKLTIILSIAAMMLAVSCNKAEAPAQEEVVTYSVSMPVTKAVNADGSSINKVWYALYKMDGTLVKDYGTVDFTGGNAHCSVVMMRGQSYKIAFVAQHDNVYTVSADAKTITMPAAPQANLQGQVSAVPSLPSRTEKRPMPCSCSRDASSAANAQWSAPAA